MAMPCHECFFSFFSHMVQLVNHRPGHPGYSRFRFEWSRNYFFSKWTTDKIPIVPLISWSTDSTSEFFSWSPICNPPFLIRIATPRKIEHVEIIAISLGFYQLLSFLGLLLYACFYQTQPNSSSGVRWFHAGRRCSQIEEQGVAINISSLSSCKYH